jgi:hypothetical protein
LLAFNGRASQPPAPAGEINGGSHSAELSDAAPAIRTDRDDKTEWLDLSHRKPSSPTDLASIGSIVAAETRSDLSQVKVTLAIGARLKSVRICAACNCTLSSYMPTRRISGKSQHQSRDPAPASSKRPRGRPAHVTDPPVLLATTIPESLDRLLREIARETGRPRSEHLVRALRAYCRRYRRNKTQV